MRNPSSSIISSQRWSGVSQLLLLVVLGVCALFTTGNTNVVFPAGAIDAAVEDAQQQQQLLRRQPFAALFAVAAQSPQRDSEEENGSGIGSPSQMAKRHLLNALVRQGRSPRSASSATMRNALVRFGKRALLLPSMMPALDDKRNPPQPFVRFGRSSPAAAPSNSATFDDQPTAAADEHHQQQQQAPQLFLPVLWA